MNKLSALDWIALVLVIIGGLNWGLVGINGLDVVSLIFGAGGIIARVIFLLVGLSALYLIFVVGKFVRK